VSIAAILVILLVASLTKRFSANGHALRLSLVSKLAPL